MYTLARKGWGVVPLTYSYTPDELRADLERLGIDASQNALARALGVHRVTVGQWFDGKRRLPSSLPWALKALAAGLRPAPREAEALRAWMKRNAYTPETLGEAPGIDASTVRRWLSGERPVAPQYALALAAVAADTTERTRRRAAATEAKGPGRRLSVLERPKDVDIVIEPIRFSRRERQVVGEAASAAGMQPRTFIKRRALEGLPV